jgi:pimeloyl-ACP methyl ester carboxylesterase
MTFVRANDIDLFTRDEHHTGEARVLVHGGWDDHTAWNGVAPLLCERCRVVRYDRRGYGRTERPAGPRLRRQDEEDLAGLIEALGCAPAHVVGNSFGASTALALALLRPELFCSLTIHEPPLIRAASAQPRLRPQLDEVQATIGSAAAQLRDGDLVGGAKRFVEDVALGPGAWQELPPKVREEVVRNAPGFLGDIEDPGWADLDLAASVRVGCPVLVTWGSQSPSWLREVATFVAGRIDGAQSRQLEGSGHLPHMTHPQEYAAVVEDFLASTRAAAS